MDARVNDKTSSRRRGVILLEVVLALALFFAAAGVILGSLSSAISVAQDVRLKAQANDLCVTVISEIQVGLIAQADTEPTAFDPPFDDWTYAIVDNKPDDTLGGPALDRVEVTVHHDAEAYTQTLVQLLPPATAAITTDTTVSTGP